MGDLYYVPLLWYMITEVPIANSSLNFIAATYLDSFFKTVVDSYWCVTG